MEHHDKKYLPWQTPLAAAAFVPPLLGQEPNAVPLGRQVKLVPPSEERVARIIKQAHQKVRHNRDHISITEMTLRENQFTFLGHSA